MTSKLQFPVNKEKAIELLGKLDYKSYTLEEGLAMASDETLIALVQATGINMMRAKAEGKSLTTSLVAMAGCAMQLGYLLALDQIEAQKFDKMFES